MSNQDNPQDLSNQIHQAIDQNQGQAIGQMFGGIVIGQLIIYYSQKPIDQPVSAPSDFSPNPYQGLNCFYEEDGDRFFGRSSNIEELVKKFLELQDDQNEIRILPIHGPSGSGKSSLVRAGLIPALSKPSLAGKYPARVLVLIPNTKPLEKLSTVLARVATNDPVPAAKEREFNLELRQRNADNKFDGLRRLASMLPDIDRSPLIILIDQFEEIYTLCEDQDERNIFVENLLCAASDKAQHVSVILTLRSDFLGMTHQHPQLNQLFSSQGFLVPVMQRDQLEQAITEPAKQAHHELDKATVRSLLNEVDGNEVNGNEGVLPLLQFALFEIWEGLSERRTPTETLEKIGGVGGALTHKARATYEALSEKEKSIARSLFLSLIEPHEDGKSTRRRAQITELITHDVEENAIRDTIRRFAQPKVRILVTSCDEQQVEMVEIAHEALIRHWQDLKDWLDTYKESLRKKRKIEEAARDWQNHNQSKDYLLQGRSLRDAKEFIDNFKESDLKVSALSLKLVKVSLRNQKIALLKSLTLYSLLPGFIVFHALIIFKTNEISVKDDCKPDLGIRELLQYIWWTGNAKSLADRNFCKENLSGIKLTGVNMPRCNFNLSNVFNTSFRNSNLSFSTFQGATLARTDFGRTILIGSDFRCHNNICSSLIKTNFEDADLQESQFRGAVMEGVILRGANLEQVDLSHVQGLTAKQLEGALLCKTILPSNFKDASGNLVSGDRNCP